MIRHCVLMTWVDDATDEQRRAVAEGLAGLPAAIPELRAYRFGPDLGIVAGNASFAVVADFDDADGFRAYAEHPLHQQVIAERIKPIVARRVAVQFEV